MTLYRKKPDLGAAGCTAWLFLFSAAVATIVSFFLEGSGGLKIYLYIASIPVLILVIVGVAKYISHRKEGIMMLSISEEGIHYYTHPSPVHWKKISNIEIVDQRLSVSIKSSPSLNFTLNLYDTDLQNRSDSFYQLLSSYYARRIYRYDAAPSFGC